LIPVLNPDNFEDGKKEGIDYSQNYILENDHRFESLNSITEHPDLLRRNFDYCDFVPSQNIL
jgi:hypothetical protein